MKDGIFIFFAKIFKIYSYRRNRYICDIINNFYTAWVSNEFLHFGSCTRIHRPFYTTGGRNIKIGNYSLFYHHCEVDAFAQYQGFHYTPTVEIGDNCQFGPYTHITCCNKIKIGNGVLTGSNVLISDNNHGTLSDKDIDIMPKFRKLTSKGEIIIEDNVWIGDKVAILGGVHIGYGAIIAANSVVTHDVPSKTIVAGVPAREIKVICV